MSSFELMKGMLNSVQKSSLLLSANTRDKGGICLVDMVKNAFCEMCFSICGAKQAVELLECSIEPGYVLMVKTAH